MVVESYRLEDSGMVTRVTKSKRERERERKGSKRREKEIRAKG